MKLKRKILKELRARLKRIKFEQTAHHKQYGRCFSDCVENNQMNAKEYLLDELIDWVLEQEA